MIRCSDDSSESQATVRVWSRARAAGGTGTGSLPVARQAHFDTFKFAYGPGRKL